MELDWEAVDLLRETLEQGDLRRVMEADRTVKELQEQIGEGRVGLGHALRLVFGLAGENQSGCGIPCPVFYPGLRHGRQRRLKD